MIDLMRALLITLVVCAVILVSTLLFSCREAITYDNDIEYIYEVCDTISVKFNYPEVGYITYTIRCTDQFGDERTYLIIDKL